MNHIVLGVDDTGPTGMVLGFIDIAAVVLSWVAAHYISWYFPRGLQHAEKALTQPTKLITLDRLIPQERYTREQISPYFWPNGKMPERDDWKRLAAHSFRDYKLKIGGLVENPVALSLQELRELGDDHHAPLHSRMERHCAMPGNPHAAIDRACETKGGRRGIAFYSFGPALFVGVYYATQDLNNAMKPECLLRLR